MRHSVLIALAALAVSVTSAMPAYAGPVEDFRNNGGQINPCNYSPQQLADARGNLSPDVLQYSPGLADQLSAGQEGCGGGPSDSPNPRTAIPDPGDTDQDGDIDSNDAAAGAGGGGGGGGGTGGGAPARRPVSLVPDAPTPATRARARLADIATPTVAATTRSDVPGWVVALLLALGLGALLFALARFGGLSGERLTAPLRASFGDAGGRGADALAEVWDSVRLGR